jgi:hypothetical protein
LSLSPNSIRSFDMEICGANAYPRPFSSRLSCEVRDAADLETDSHFCSVYHSCWEDIPQMRNNWLCTTSTRRELSQLTTQSSRETVGFRVVLAQGCSLQSSAYVSVCLHGVFQCDFGQSGDRPFPKVGTRIPRKGAEAAAWSLSRFAVLAETRIAVAQMRR